MNNKGMIVLVNIMLAFTIIIMGVVMIDPLKEQHEQANTDLDCTNSSITTGNRMACVVNDASFPVFLLAVFGVGVAYIGAKKAGWIGGNE